MNLIQIKQIDGLQSALDALAASVNNLDTTVTSTLGEHYDLISDNKVEVDKLVLEKNVLADQGISGISFVNGLGYPGVEGLKTKQIDAFSFNRRDVDGIAGLIYDRYANKESTYPWGRVDVVKKKTFDAVGDIVHNILNDSGLIERDIPFRLPVRIFKEDEGWTWGNTQASILLDGKTETNTTYSDELENFHESTETKFFSKDDVFSFPKKKDYGFFGEVKSYRDLFSEDFVNAATIPVDEDVGILELNSGEALEPAVDCAITGLFYEFQKAGLREKSDYGTDVVNAEHSFWRQRSEFVQSVEAEYGEIYDYVSVHRRKPLIRSISLSGNDVYYDWELFHTQGIMKVFDGVVVTHDSYDDWLSVDTNQEPTYTKIDTSVTQEEILQDCRELLGIDNETDSLYYAEETTRVFAGVYSWSTSFKKYSDDSDADYEDVYAEFRDAAISGFAGLTIGLPKPLEGREIHILSKDNRLKTRFFSYGGTIEGRPFLTTQGEGDLHFYANGSAWYVVGDYSASEFEQSGKYYNAFQSYSSYPPFYEIVNSINYEDGFTLTAGHQLLGVRTDELKDESQITITLPEPYKGKEFIIKDEGIRAGDKNIVINGGGESIEGRDEISIDEDGGHVHLYADGKNWFTLSQNGIDYSGSSLALGSTASPAESNDKTIVRYEEINSSNYSGPDHRIEEFSSIVGVKYSGIVGDISLVLPRPFASKVIRVRDEIVPNPAGATGHSLILKNVNGETIVSEDIGFGRDYTLVSDGETWKLVSLTTNRDPNS